MLFLYVVMEADSDTTVTASRLPIQLCVAGIDHLSDMCQVLRH